MRVITIGRDSINDIQFADDPHVTRSCHCQIIREDDGSYSITDYSANGTFVNNRKMDKGVSVKLNEYDIIRIGSITPPLRWKEYFKNKTEIIKETESIKKTETKRETDTGRSFKTTVQKQPAATSILFGFWLWLRKKFSNK